MSAQDRRRREHQLRSEGILAQLALEVQKGRVDERYLRSDTYDLRIRRLTTEARQLDLDVVLTEAARMLLNVAGAAISVDIEYPPEIDDEVIRVMLETYAGVRNDEPEPGSEAPGRGMSAVTYPPGRSPRAARLPLHSNQVELRRYPNPGGAA